MAPDAPSATVPKQRAPEATPAEPSRAASAAPAGPRVLLVDDNDELCASLAAVLAEHGLSVETAGGAGDATALLRDHAFDAAVIDLVMPGTHGLTLLAELRALENGRDMACVVMSGLPAGDARTKARKQVGRFHAAAFVDKPVTPRRLLITLGRLLAAR